MRTEHSSLDQKSCKVSRHQEVSLKHRSAPGDPSDTVWEHCPEDRAQDGTAKLQLIKDSNTCMFARWTNPGPGTQSKGDNKQLMNEQNPKYLHSLFTGTFVWTSFLHTSIFPTIH